MRKTLLTGFSLVAITLGGLASADGHISDEQIQAAMKARQAHMQLYSFHLGTLGGMAQESIPFDAAAAQTAAESLAAMAALDQSGYWLPGSDSDSVEGSRALPAIWADGSDIGAKAMAFRDVATSLPGSVGDLDALKASVGQIGGACGDCHKAYRLSNN